jgi:hypothetical protein
MATLLTQGGFHVIELSANKGMLHRFPQLLVAADSDIHPRLAA